MNPVGLTPGSKTETDLARARRQVTMVLKRPILMGGLGLSATFWLLDSLHFNLFDGSTLLSAMALGTGVWWWRKTLSTRPKPELVLTPPVADAASVDAALQQIDQLIETLQTEVAETTVDLGPVVTECQSQLATLRSGLERQTLTVALVGDFHTGKTTLLQHLEMPQTEAHQSAICFEELAWDQADAESDLGHDALLLVTDGDITESTYARLRDRLLAGQSGVVIFNKADQYSPDHQATILQQLQHRVAALPGQPGVVVTAANPRPIKVRRLQTDGQAQEWLEPVPPQLSDLQQFLQTQLVDRRAQLVLATTLRQAETLRRQVQSALNQVRRQRAMPLVEQLQWVAAAAAFANPVATLDLLATVAINGQLIVDLGQVYGFKLSLEDGKTAAGTLAALAVKLGLVEISTQALTLVLKSHAATYVAGGLVQGLSAAYLTRMAGLSLIEYFETTALEGRSATAISWESVAQRLQGLLQNRQTEFLQSLVKQGLERLRPTPTAPTLITSNPA